MSERDATAEDFQADIAQERANAAQAWDENLPLQKHKRDVVGAAEAELLGKRGYCKLDDSCPPPPPPPPPKKGDTSRLDMSTGRGRRRRPRRRGRGFWAWLFSSDRDEEIFGNDNEEYVTALGAIADEIFDGGEFGWLQFQGKEDYIRGETACLNGMNVIGSVIGQRDLAVSRNIALNQQGAGFRVKKLPDGKSFLSLNVNKGAKGGVTVKSFMLSRNVAMEALKLGVKASVNKARMVAKNAKMVANTLKNFKGSGKSIVGDEAVGEGVAWIDIIGEFSEIFGDAHTDIVGEARLAFDDVLGALPKRRGRLPSDAQVRQLARDLEFVANRLNTNADKLEKNVDTEIKKQQDAGKKRQEHITRIRNLRIAGDEGDMLDDAVTELLGDNKPDDPNKWGYNLDGTIDWDATNPDMPGGAGAPTGSTEAPVGPIDYFADLPPGPPDYGMGETPKPTPLPTAESVKPIAGKDYLPDPYTEATQDDTVYHGGADGKLLPLGAVIYEGQMPMANRSVGSKNHFTGGYQGNTGNTSGFFLMDPTRWLHADLTLFDLKPRPVPPSFKTVIDIAQNSIARGWGPIVGNPTDPNWKGLRLDADSGAFFWYYDKAPSWATMVQDQERLKNAVFDHETKFKKIMTDYETDVAAAKTEYLSAVGVAKSAKKEADRLAREWAAKQERMQREAVETDHQLTQDALRFDAQQAQEQTKLDMQMQQQQAQEDADYRKIEMQLQQQWLQQGGQPAPGGPFDDVQQEGGPAPGGPFDDVQQSEGFRPDRGGSDEGEGPFDDLAQSQISEAMNQPELAE